MSSFQPHNRYTCDRCAEMCADAELVGPWPPLTLCLPCYRDELRECSHCGQKTHKDSLHTFDDAKGAYCAACITCKCCGAQALPDAMVERDGVGHVCEACADRPEDRNVSRWGTEPGR